MLRLRLSTTFEASAEVALRDVIGGPHERNIELHFARSAVDLRLHFDEVGLTDTIGSDRFHGTVTAAVRACAVRSDLSP